MTNPTEAHLMRPGGLARELRRLRETAGLTGVALAEKVGWAQPKLSKIETGKQLPTEEEVRAYSLAVGADDDVVRHLLDLHSQAGAISREWRLGTADGQAEIQREYDRVVREGAVIRNLEVTTVPGLLQTPEYARYQAMQAVTLHGFSADEVAAAVEAKMRRQDVLYDAGKRFEFVVVEAALRLGWCPADVMLGQLDRLMSLTFASSSIWFGIIPFQMGLPTVAQNRFIMVDDQVLVEHFAGDEAYLQKRAATYAKVMDLMRDEAVTGEQARNLILAAMQWIRDSHS